MNIWFEIGIYQYVNQTTIKTAKECTVDKT